MSIDSLLNLDKAAMYFNTVYSNLDLDLYMECGAALWKTFNPKRFLDEKILEKYKQLDKLKKRIISVTKEDIDNSFEYMNAPLKVYCSIIDLIDNRYSIISGYLKNKIHTTIIVYCLYHRYIKFDDIDKMYIYYILNQYSEWVSCMLSIEDYIKEKDLEYTKRFENE